MSERDQGRNSGMELLPPATIGIIGGGQLGMFTAEAAKKLGYRVAILDPASDCPAKRFADRHIVADFSDPTAYLSIAECSDALTYEFEHIDADILEELEESGVRLYPSAKCLGRINDKFAQKKMLRTAGIPVPDFLSLDEIGEYGNLERLGLPLVFKHRRGGYDGRGIIVARTEVEARQAWRELTGKNAFAERYVRFERELSLIVAKDLAGNWAIYPPAENVHKDGILRMSRAPARISDEVRLRTIDVSRSAVSLLGSPGVFCVEMFLDRNLNVLVNEIAPRPHNSGHHTLDACVTSQYEQLIRVLSGKPLGSTEQTTPCVMMNILGAEGVQGSYSLAGAGKNPEEREVRCYWYGKETTRHLRKLGHVTVLDSSLDRAELKAKEIHRGIVIAPNP